MNIAAKVFVTYAAISMISGFFLIILTMGDIIPFKFVPTWVVMVLWMGPLMLAVAIGAPIGIWILWTEWL